MTTLSLLEKEPPVAAEPVLPAANEKEKVSFEILTRRSALLKALAHVQGIVEKRNIVPILSNVKLEAKDNILQLTATDMELAVTEKVNADVRKAGSLTVPAHTFYDIVRKLPDDEDIELSVPKKDSGKLNIIAGNCKFSLSYLPVEEFPAMDYGNMSHKFNIKSEVLADLIDKNKFSISTEETRYNLNGIFFHVLETEEKKALRAVATDGHRLSRMEIALPEGASNMPGIILPRKTVMEIRKLIEGEDSEITIELSESKIKFSFSDIQLISKLIDGTFPDYEHLIPQDNKMVMRVNAENFSKAVDRVSIITFEKLRAIKLNLKGESLTVSATGEANGSASEELKIEYNDKDIEVGFNSKYLLEIMASIQGENVEFLFADDIYAPALVKDPSDESALYVIMPMLV